MTSLTKITCQKISLGDGWHLNIVSKSIATITDPKGNRKTSYFGFDSNLVSALVARYTQRVNGWGMPTKIKLSDSESLQFWSCLLFDIFLELLNSY